LRLAYFKLAPGEAILSEFLRLAQEKGSVLIFETLGTVPQEIQDTVTRLEGYNYLPVIWGFHDGSPYHPSRHTLNSLAVFGLHDSSTLRARWEEELSMDEKKKILEELFPHMDAREYGRYLGKLSPEVHGALLKMVFNSEASMAIPTWLDILGYGNERRLNIPGESLGQWTRRLPLTMGSLLTASKGDLSDTDASNGTKLLRYLTHIREVQPISSGRLNGKKVMLGTDPDTQSGLIQIRQIRVNSELTQPFLIEAFTKGEVIKARVIATDRDGNEYVGLMKPGAVGAGLAQGVLRYAIQFKPVEAGAYRYHVQVVKPDGTIEESKPGYLVAVKEGEDLNPLSPSYATSRYLNELTAPSRSEARAGGTPKTVRASMLYEKIVRLSQVRKTPAAEEIQFFGFDESEIQAWTEAQVRGLKASQMPWLMEDQLQMLSPEQRVWLNARLDALLEIQGTGSPSRAEVRSGEEDMWVRNLTPSSIRELTRPQIQTMTLPQIEALTWEQMQAFEKERQGGWLKQHLVRLLAAQAKGTGLSARSEVRSNTPGVNGFVVDGKNVGPEYLSATVKGMSAGHVIFKAIIENGVFRLGISPDKIGGETVSDSVIQDPPRQNETLYGFVSPQPQQYFMLLYKYIPLEEEEIVWYRDQAILTARIFVHHGFRQNILLDSSTRSSMGKRFYGEPNPKTLGELAALSLSSESSRSEVRAVDLTRFTWFRDMHESPEKERIREKVGEMSVMLGAYSPVAEEFQKTFEKFLGEKGLGAVGNPSEKIDLLNMSLEIFRQTSKARGLGPFGINVWLAFPVFVQFFGAHLLWIPEHSDRVRILDVFLRIIRGIFALPVRDVEFPWKLFNGFFEILERSPAQAMNFNDQTKFWDKILSVAMEITHLLKGEDLRAASTIYRSFLTSGVLFESPDAAEARKILFELRMEALLTRDKSDRQRSEELDGQIHVIESILNSGVWNNEALRIAVDQTKEFSHSDLSVKGKVLSEEQFLSDRIKMLDLFLEIVREVAQHVTKDGRWGVNIAYNGLVTFFGKTFPEILDHENRMKALELMRFALRGPLQSVVKRIHRFDEAVEVLNHRSPEGLSSILRESIGKLRAARTEGDRVFVSEGFFLEMVLFAQQQEAKWILDQLQVEVLFAEKGAIQRRLKEAARRIHAIESNMGVSASESDALRTAIEQAKDFLGLYLSTEGEEPIGQGSRAEMRTSVDEQMEGLNGTNYRVKSKFIATSKVLSVGFFLVGLTAFLGWFLDLPLLNRIFSYAYVFGAGSVFISVYIFVFSKLLQREDIQRKKIERRLQLATASADMGVWEWNISKDHMVWDDRMYEIYGVERKDFSGKFSDWEKLIHPDDVSRVTEAMQAAVSGTKEFDITFRIQSGDGTVRYIKADAVVTRHADGTPSQMVGLNSDVTKMKRMNRALKDSERKFKAIFEEAPVGIAIIDAGSRRIHEVNSKFLMITGRKKEEAASLDLVSMTHPEDVQKVLENLTLLNEGKIPGFSMEKRCMRPDGSTLSINVTVTPMDGRDKNSKLYLCMIQDISERKQSEVKMRESHELLAKFSEQLPGAIYELRMSPERYFTIPFASEKFEDFFGIPLEELRKNGALVFAPMHPEDRSKNLRAILASVKNMGVLHQEFRVMLPGQKEVRWLLSHSQPEKLPDGSVLWHGFISDITESKRVEESLRASEEKFRSIVESSPTAKFLYHLTSRGHLVLTGTNPAASKLTGVPAGSLVGKTVEETFPILAGTKIPEIYEGVARGDLGPQTFEWRDKSGGTETFYYFHIFRTGQGTIVANVTDITTRKKSEDLAATQETLAAIGTNAAAMAHEINNPLAGAEGWLELLGISLGQAIPAEATAPLYHARERIAHAREIIRRLLLSVHKKESPLGIFSISKVLRTVAAQQDFLLKKNFIEIRLSIDDEFPVFGNEVGFSQVIANLLKNAIDALEEVSGKRLIEVIAQKTGDHEVTIRIRDTGKGGNQADVPRWFEYFFTTKPEGQGTGIGLPLVSKIIKDDFHGKIEVATQEGQGTEFRVTIPLLSKDLKSEEDSETAQEVREEPLAPGARSVRRILVVEDEKTLREVYAAFLKQISPSTDVKVAKDGQAALDLVRQETEPFDLVVTDFNMPRMDGLKFVEAFRRYESERFPAGEERAFLVMMTAYGAEGGPAGLEDKTKALLAQGILDGIEMKTIRREPLLALLERASQIRPAPVSAAISSSSPKVPSATEKPEDASAGDDYEVWPSKMRHDLNNKLGAISAFDGIFDLRSSSWSGPISPMNEALSLLSKRILTINQALMRLPPKAASLKEASAQKEKVVSGLREILASLKQAEAILRDSLSGKINVASVSPGGMEFDRDFQQQVLQGTLEAAAIIEAYLGSIRGSTSSPEQSLSGVKESDGAKTLLQGSTTPDGSEDNRGTSRSEIRQLSWATNNGQWEGDTFNVTRGAFPETHVLDNIATKLRVAREVTGNIVEIGVTKLKSFASVIVRSLFPEHFSAVPAGALADKSRETAKMLLGIRTVTASDVFVLGHGFFSQDYRVAAGVREIYSATTLVAIVNTAGERAFLKELNLRLAKEGLLPILAAGSETSEELRAHLATVRGTVRATALLYGSETIPEMLKHHIPNTVVVTSRMLSGFLNAVDMLVSGIVSDLQARFAMARSA